VFQEGVTSGAGVLVGVSMDMKGSLFRGPHALVPNASSKGISDWLTFDLWRSPALLDCGRYLFVYVCQSVSGYGDLARVWLKF
jgi:hypothetical protein